MKTVENRHIREIIELSEEGMSDTVYWDDLEGRSDASPYDFFVANFAEGSNVIRVSWEDIEFKYDPSWDGEGDGMNGRGCDFQAQFGAYTDWEDEWETFWSAFFNSAEDLNNAFWESWDTQLERIGDGVKEGGYSLPPKEKIKIWENNK